jgi:RND family efflux transporter MFP subunit
MSRRTLLLGLAVVGTLTIAISGGYATRRPLLSVSVTDVTRGPISREVLSSGVLEPKAAVNVGSQVSGTIQSLSADFNHRVKSGQIIAQIDPAPYDTRLAEARAELIRSEAESGRRRVELEDLRTKAGRAVELETQGLITQAQLDAAQFAVRQVEAELKAAVAATRAATAGVAEAEVNRSRTTIRAPMDGIVVSRHVEIGQTIAASFNSPVLFRIADLRKMQLLVDVGEAEAGEVRRGAPVTFEIESIGPREFRSTISEVRLSPVVSQTSSSSGATGTAGATATSGTTAAGRGAAATSGTASQGNTPTGSVGTATATQPGAASNTPATQPGAASNTTVSAPAGAVVSYTAVVDVDNSDGEIVPGSTAVVMLPTGRRADALRVKNAALSFRPNADVLKASGQSPRDVPEVDRAPDAAGRGYVWKYEAGKFVAIAVVTGVADERWTEVTAGNIQPGDRLVTQAEIPRR